MMARYAGGFALNPADGRARKWTEKRRAKVSEIHRARHGAPPGYSTVYGVHVPFAIAKAVRYWADREANDAGPAQRFAAGQAFVRLCEQGNWSNSPALVELWKERLIIRENRKIIRSLENGARR